MATTIKDVEALETGSDGMTGDEYIAWFTANINFIERSAKKKKFISRKKKSARAEMEARKVNIWDGIEIENLGAKAAEVPQLAFVCGLCLLDSAFHVHAFSYTQLGVHADLD